MGRLFVVVIKGVAVKEKMSIRLIDWAFNQNCKSPAQKLVLIKLADNANDEGKCWPSLSHISKHCQIDRAGISRHCKELASQGLIEIVPRFKDGVQLPNVYRLKISDVGCCASATVLRQEQHGVAPVTTGGVAPGATRTVIREPSLEPKSTHAPRAFFPDLDPILRSDLETIALTASPKAQKDAVIWARESSKYGHSVALVSSTLQAFAKAETVDKPRSWLIAVFNKLEAKHNGMEFEKEHEKRKREERDWAKMYGGSLLGLLTRGAQDGQD